VVELIGPLTISAGDSHAGAYAPHAAHRADRREYAGGFSDVLGRKLNGWRFGLPNEIYRTADGKIFDLLGMPPDIEVPVLADADVAAGKDPGDGQGARDTQQANDLSIESCQLPAITIKRGSGKAILGESRAILKYPKVRFADDADATG
jgi:hypothetical protein